MLDVENETMRNLRKLLKIEMNGGTSLNQSTDGKKT